MTSLKIIPVLALLCLISSPAWSGPVDFCKVITNYDESSSIPPEVVYEDCSGYAFYDYAKNYVKASCWKGATNLLDGKCELHKVAESNGIAAEDSGNDEQ